MNRRIYRSTTTETVRYLYDGWHAVEERNSAGTAVKKQFVYGEGLDEILRMDQYSGGSISASYYCHTDALGSVTALTNSAGAVVERVKYSSCGQPYFLDANNNLLVDGGGNFLASSTIGNPLLFTAARYDGETGARTASPITDATGDYYLRNRYLDSDKGRFTTRDPIGMECTSCPSLFVLLCFQFNRRTNNPNRLVFGEEVKSPSEVLIPHQ